jgi:hypothetical protein
VNHDRPQRDRRTREERIVTISRLILSGLLVLIPAAATGGSPPEALEVAQAGEAAPEEGEAIAPAEASPPAGEVPQDKEAPEPGSQEAEEAAEAAEEAAEAAEEAAEAAEQAAEAAEQATEAAGEAAEAAGAPAADPAQQIDSGSPGMGSIARAQFTTQVVELEPVDDLTTVSTEHDEVYFFTELRDFTGQTVTHRWERQGEVIAEVPFQVGGPRWRVYSRKKLLPGWTGDWTVTVLDGEGDAVETWRFTYAAAPAKASPRPAETAPEEPRGPARPAMEPSQNGQQEDVEVREQERGAPAEEQPPPAAQQP